MHDTNLPSPKQNLEHVRQQFERWRNTRRRKERIPGYLWDAATSLAGQYSLSLISSTLRVNYSDLRRRIQGPSYASGNTCSFVEVNVSGGSTTYPYTIELEDRFGSRMKICCSGGVVMNPAELIKVFKE